MKNVNHPGGSRHATVLLMLALLICVCLGCGGSSMQAPLVNPQDAAAEAMELYDTDDDGLLSEQELTACPGLLSALTRYDADGDLRISPEELAAKLEKVFSSGVAMVPVRCFVMLGRRPLGGAHVRYVPEAFLGPAVLAA